MREVQADAVPLSRKGIEIDLAPGSTNAAMTATFPPHQSEIDSDTLAPDTGLFPAPDRTGLAGNHDARRSRSRSGEFSAPRGSRATGERVMLRRTIHRDAAPLRVHEFSRALTDDGGA